MSKLKKCWVVWELAATSTVLAAWCPARVQPAATPPLTRRVLRGPSGGAWSVTWSPDGRQLASVDDARIRCWDVTTGRQSRPIGEPDGRFESVHWTTGGLLAVLNRSGHAVLWNATTQKDLVRLHGVVGEWVAWDREGRRLADRGGGIWDLSTGKLLQYGPGEAVAGAAISPDGKRLALVSHEGNVRVTDAETGRGLRVLQSVIGWDFGHSPRPVAWSADGKRVAAATFRTPEPDDVARVWEVDTATELFTHPGRAEAKDDWLWAIAWSPDGKRLAYSRHQHTRVWLWEPSSGRVQVLAAGAVPASLAFSPDGWHLAAGCVEGSILIWRLPPSPVE